MSDKDKQAFSRNDVWFWMVITAFISFFWIIFFSVGRDYKSDYRDIRIRYFTSICKHKGLVLNNSNSDPWCMDPNTKVISEIEE